MGRLLGALLGTIAIGVLLIAYGLLNPRTVAGLQVSSFPGGETVTYPLAQPVSQRLVFEDDASVAGTSQFQLRCEPGQRALVRQSNGAAVAECVGAIAVDRYGAAATPVSYLVNEPRAVRAYQTSSQAPQRTVSRVERAPRRNWKKTALVIGGSTATGAGVGALFGGKKGAAIGAAIGGGASSLWEAKH